METSKKNIFDEVDKIKKNEYPLVERDYDSKSNELSAKYLLAFLAADIDIFLLREEDQ